MNARVLGLLLVVAGFGLLTALALADVGYWGILAPHFQSLGAAQVLTDLVILAVLSCGWMWQDSARSGVKAWPFVALTLVAGSFGILGYLLVREWRGRPSK